MKGTVGTHLKNELGLHFTCISIPPQSVILLGFLPQYAGDILCDLIIKVSEIHGSIL